MKFTKPKDYYSYLFFLIYPVMVAVVIIRVIGNANVNTFYEAGIFIQLIVVIFIVMIPVTIFAGLWEFNQFFYQYYVGEDYLVIKKVLGTYKLQDHEINRVEYKKVRLYARGNVRKNFSRPGMRIKIKYHETRTLSFSIKLDGPEKKTIYKFLKSTRFKFKTKNNY